MAKEKMVFFRTAIGGFNREDVVRYIEYINSKNTSAVNQLKSENQSLKDELNALRANQSAPVEPAEDLRPELDAALAKIAELPESEREAATAEAYAKAEKDVTKFSLKIVADKLNEYLGGKVTFATDIIGEDAQAKIAAMENGTAVLIENVRFDARETKNNPEFAKALADLAGEGGLFVNDAFGTAHRAHASTAGVADYLPAVWNGDVHHRFFKLCILRAADPGGHDGCAGIHQSDLDLSDWCVCISRTGRREENLCDCLLPAGRSSDHRPAGRTGIAL